ncbi:MAG: hypothetical protein JNK53_05150, partial [Phycisphaerae bacterium]|nr:hypothetical protein [Phycisphaerae bacterium]
MNGSTLELFESVRAALNGRQMDDAQWRDLAMRVSETATEFRRRLDRSVRYARMGLRLEAASEAEAEPALFELAQILDTEDYHKWRALCTRQQWPVPELPDAASLGEIEEAISQLRPLRRLLARMRVLVLSDAGPWERMQVLRELVARDPHNAVWQDDLEAIEPVCAQWLAERADAALRANNLDRAAECVENLEHNDWQNTSVDRRVTDLRARLDAAMVAECASQAEQAVLDLEREWAAEHLSGAAEALHAWSALQDRAARHGGELPASLAQRAAAAAAWAGDRQANIDALREHEARASQLKELLDGGKFTLKDLRRALAASEATADGCPLDLRRRALDEVAQLERRSNMIRSLSAV